MWNITYTTKYKGMNGEIHCKILFLEDDEDDVELVKHELEKSGVKMTFRRVSSKKDYLFELDHFKPDVILADYALPMFNGMHAFRLFKEREVSIPFILITGVLTEQLAHECQNEGVDDFVLKSRFSSLPTVITRNLEIKKAEVEKRRITGELEKSNNELQSLRVKSEKSKIQEMLSPREFEILCLIASGVSIKEMAEQLCLSPATIATYRARLLEKMNLKTNVDLTRYALRNHLVE
jgi:two-component system invasion response regulator UvrY